MPFHFLTKIFVYNKSVFVRHAFVSFLHISYDRRGVNAIIKSRSHHRLPSCAIEWPNRSERLRVIAISCARGLNGNVRGNVWYAYFYRTWTEHVRESRVMCTFRYVPDFKRNGAIYSARIMMPLRLVTPQWWMLLDCYRRVQRRGFARSRDNQSAGGTNSEIPSASRYVNGVSR